MTARYSALPTLCLGLLLAFSASGQDLFDQTLSGVDSLNVRLKGGANTFSIKGPSVEPAVLSIDDQGDGTYSTAFDVDGNVNTEKVNLDVSIDTSGRRPELRLDDPAQLEPTLVAILRAHNPRFGVVTVSADPSSVKTKLKTRINLALKSSISIDVNFTATTRLAGFEQLEGKLKLRPRVAATIPGACTACGASYTGTTRVNNELSQCGVLRAGVADAILLIDPDDDDDGGASFDMTDELETHLFGLAGNAGKRLSCKIEAAGQSELLSLIQADIVEQCGELLDEITARLRLRLNRDDLTVIGLTPLLNYMICQGGVGKNGERVSLDLFMRFRTTTILAPHSPPVQPSQGPRGTGTLKGSFSRDAL